MDAFLLLLLLLQWISLFFMNEFSISLWHTCTTSISFQFLFSRFSFTRNYFFFIFSSHALYSFMHTHMLDRCTECTSLEGSVRKLKEVTETDTNCRFINNTKKKDWTDGEVLLLCVTIYVASGWKRFN